MSTPFTSSFPGWLQHLHRADWDFVSLIPWENMQPAAAAWVHTCRTGRWLLFWEVSGHISLLRNVGGHKLLLKYNKKTKKIQEVNFWKRQDCKVNQNCLSCSHCHLLLYLFNRLFSITKVYLKSLAIYFNFTLGSNSSCYLWHIPVRTVILVQDFNVFWLLCGGYKGTFTNNEIFR